ncbi:MAG: sigma 54-interacting transcriptional regulator [Firmicutes bacterium]|nr:sigma 54-interacting transcriptional regulator [Bacillota bacterium]
MTSRNFQEALQILELMVENPYMGLVYIDLNENVLLINQTYCDILGIKKEDAIGRHIYEITPHSRLPEVLRTEETHLADLWRANGHDMIITRTPIYDNGKLIGALGRSLFLDLSAARILVDKLNQLENQLEVYREEVKKIHTAKYFLHDLVGSSSGMQEVKRIARQVSKSVSSVLIQGETGTGKELLANAIHNSSARSSQPFIRVTCASLSPFVLESELFGYDEGAFTGAKKGGKPGRFELGNRGTIFLDEVGEIPLEMQTKLLTFLQEREFERVGGTKTIKVDVRIIAATNLDLEKAVAEGRFRRDLYYRLNVVNINIPPLRRRLEDLPELTKFFLKKLNQKLGTRVNAVSKEALRMMQGYEWPGNVREMENLMERAIMAADMKGEARLEVYHFPSLSRNRRPEAALDPDVTLSEVRGDIEKKIILECLVKNNNDKTATAKELGIHLSALYRKLNKYGISQRKNSAYKT